MNIGSINVAGPDSRPRGRKRGRKTTSCTQCHSRKQKCNQEQPCSRCIQRGVPDLCQWPESDIDDGRERGMSSQDAVPATGRAHLCICVNTIHVESGTIRSRLVLTKVFSGLPRDGTGPALHRSRRSVILRQFIFWAPSGCTYDP